MQNNVGVSKGFIEEFDGYLYEKGLSFEGVAVGSAPLILITEKNAQFHS